MRRTNLRSIVRHPIPEQPKTELRYERSPMSIAKTVAAAFGACLLILASMTQPLLAQVNRAKQPDPEPPPKAAFPPYETFKLKNGLKVFLVKNDKPIVTFRMLVRGGKSAEGGQTYISDVAADLMDKGTTTVSAKEFAERIDFVGGSISASSSDELISVSARGLKKHLEVILNLYSDAIINPAYAQEELDKYIQDQITGLASAKARSEFLADYATRKLMFGTTPIGRMPTEDDMRNITREKVLAFHNTWFVPSNATLAVVGNITKEDLVVRLESAFANWKSGKQPTVAKLDIPERKGRRLIVVDRPAAVQSTIRVIGSGPAMNDPERPKSSILNNVFGGGTGLGNRLTMNLRETHAYTYSPYSYFDPNPFRSMFIATADVRNAVTDSAVKEMLHEMARMRNEAVPGDELNRNIQSAIGGFLMSVSDPAVTASRVQSIDFFKLPKDYFAKLPTIYNATTAADVQRLAKKYFVEDNLAIVIVGKASEIADKLKQFGTVEVWDADLNPVGGTDASADIGMTAQQVWDKMLAAMGGEATMRSVTSRKMQAELAANAGSSVLKGKFEMIEEAPNKVYQMMDMGIAKTEQYSTGTSVTMLVSRGGTPPQAQKVEGEAAEKYYESTHIMPEAYVKDLGATLKVKGKKVVNGVECVQIAVVYPKSGEALYSINASTYLPVRIDPSMGMPSILSDWKSVDGVMFPFAITIIPIPGQEIHLKDIQYKLNDPISPAVFTKVQ